MNTCSCSGAELTVMRIEPCSFFLPVSSTGQVTCSSQNGHLSGIPVKVAIC